MNAIFLALLLVLSAPSARSQAPASAATVEMTFGKVKIRGVSSAKIRAAKEKAAVLAGETIVTEGGFADLRFSDETLVRMASNTSLKIERVDPARPDLRLFLNRGSVRVLVKPLVDAPVHGLIHVVLSTPEAKIFVSGTEFVVTRESCRTTVHGLDHEVGFAAARTKIPASLGGAFPHVTVWRSYFSTIGCGAGATPSEPAQFSLKDYLEELKGWLPRR